MYFEYYLPTALKKVMNINCESKKPYRQTGWIGTVEVNRDTELEPGETQRQNVSPGSMMEPIK